MRDYFSVIVQELLLFLRFFLRRLILFLRLQEFIDNFDAFIIVLWSVLWQMAYNKYLL